MSRWRPSFLLCYNNTKEWQSEVRSDLAVTAHMFTLAGSFWWSAEVDLLKNHGIAPAVAGEMICMIQHWQWAKVMIECSGMIWNQERVAKQNYLWFNHPQSSEFQCSHQSSRLPPTAVHPVRNHVSCLRSWCDSGFERTSGSSQVKSSHSRRSMEAILAATPGIQLLTLLDFSPSLSVVRHHTSQVHLPQGYSVRSWVALDIWGYTTADGLWKGLVQESTVVSLSV